MTTTVERLLDIAATFDPRAVGARGHVEALKRFHLPQGDPLPGVLLRFIDNAEPHRNYRGITPEQDRRVDDARTTRRVALGDEFVRSGKPLPPKPFTASDIEWLRGLPDDPDRVKFDDAVQLAILADQAERRSGDERLIRKVYEPVRRRFAIKTAEEKLIDAEIIARRPELPHQVLDHLAKEVSWENPELGEEESYVRARRMLNERLDARALADQYRIRTAEKELEKVKAAMPARDDELVEV